MKTINRITLCGILSALATVVLLLTVFPYATYALAAFAGMLMIPAALECGTRYGVLSYVVTSLLALLFTPDMEAKWMFILFFGYYPLVHLRLQIRQRKWLTWIMKLLLFNVAAVVGFYLLVTFVNAPSEDFLIAGVYMPWVLLAAGNVLLVVYDFALVRVGAFYRVKIHPFLRLLMK